MSSETLYRVVVIGGGITGLAAAYRLTEMSAKSARPLDIKLLDAAPRLGGVIETYTHDGFLLEGGPDAFVTDKPWGVALAKRLGIESQIIGIQPQFRKSFIVRRGRLLAVPEGFYLLAPSLIAPFLKSPLISWPGKLRMGMDLVLPRRTDGVEESLEQFVVRRLGREALDRVAQPMVGGIYTADPAKLSVKATMPRFLEMEANHRSLILAMMRSRKKQGTQVASGPRYGLFVTFQKGMQTLTDALIARLPHGTAQPNQKAQTLEKTESGWRITTEKGKTFEADAVCMALPSFEIARLLKPHSPTLAAELEQIPYSSVATLNLAYRRDDVPHPLNGAGFVCPAIEKRAILACTFCSSKFAGRAPEGRVLLRAFIGGAMFPEQLECDDATIIERTRAELKTLLGIQVPPLFTELYRYPMSMTQYYVGHLARVDRIQKLAGELPNMHLASNGYEGVGIPGCVHRGEETAEKMIAAIQ